ncbi:MAG: sigma-54 interaction domain-containing protein, partial [Thermoguttaceae bacterium]
SPLMIAVIERLKRIAPTDATVLIHGETGTGKELFAQSIHQNSPRKNKPFVALNCGALTESILESELFGHVKGAFTGALSDRLGKFEYANGGTLFLDEVGDMPMSTQIKLLRVLENGDVMRVGSNETIKVNVRILSATNRNLEEAVEAGAFRRDLYHRLKVITIRIPPLRERTEDIPVLLNHFLRHFSGKYDKKIRGISPESRKVLLHFDWPGNVRQLRNIVESMVVVDVDEMIGIDDLPEELGGIVTINTVPNNSATQKELQSDLKHEFTGDESTGEASSDLQNLVGQSLEEIEKRFIIETLRVTGGNREESANMLGIGERTLYRKIREYKIQNCIDT